jgi:hypothetical protein
MFWLASPRRSQCLSPSRLRLVYRPGGRCVVKTWTREHKRRPRGSHRGRPRWKTSSLRLHEQADEAGGALGVAGELGLQFRQRQTGRQLFGIEVGRYHHVGVVMR